MSSILALMLAVTVSGDPNAKAKPVNQWQSTEECFAALEASYGAPSHKMQILQEQALKKFYSAKQRVTLTVPIRLDPAGKNHYQASLRSESGAFAGLVPGLPETMYGKPSAVWPTVELSDKEALALPDKPNAAIVLEPGAGGPKGGVTVYFKHGNKPDEYNPQTPKTPHYRTVYYGIVSISLVK